MENNKRQPTNVEMAHQIRQLQAENRKLSAEVHLLANSVSRLRRQLGIPLQKDGVSR